MITDTTSVEKLLQISDHALELFMERGHRHTRMSDVAKRMNFTEPALYRYVDGKDSLTYLVFRRAVDLDDFVPTGPLPYTSGGRSEVIELVGDFLGEHDPAVIIPTRGRMPDDAKKEFQDLVHRLYGLLFTFRRAIRLLERMGLEWPEIYSFWYEQTRPAFFNGIARYVGLRAKQGCFVAYKDDLIAASIFTETLFEFAVRRHFDPVPIPLDEVEAENSLVAALTRMFVLEE